MTHMDNVLQELGSNSEEISNKLREAGIKGRCCDGDNCPIASYLKARGCQNNLHVGKWNVRGDQSKKIGELPIPIRQWIAEFDAGKHSEFAEEK